MSAGYELQEPGTVYFLLGAIPPHTRRERKEMLSRVVLAVLAVLSGASAFVPSTMPFSALTRKPLSKVGVAVRWLAIPVA